MSAAAAPPRPIRDAIASIAVRAVGHLSHRWALRVGGVLGRFAGLLMLGKRDTLRENLSAAGVSDARAACTRTTVEVGRNLTEMAWLLTQPEARIDPCAEVHGLDVVRAALAEGRGALLVAGHIGNWELVARAAARAGAPVGVVARSLGSRRVEAMIAAFRTAGGVKTLVRGAPGSSVAALRTLRRGGVLGCMMDRASQGRRLAVPFLGRAMKVPIGPLILAHRARCPIVFGVACRLPDGTSRVTFDRVDVSGLDDPEEMARRVAQRLQQAVRATPEQWYWIYRRASIRADRRADPADPAANPIDVESGDAALTP